MNMQTYVQLELESNAAYFPTTSCVGSPSWGLLIYYSWQHAVTQNKPCSSAQRKPFGCSVRYFYQVPMA